MHGLPTWKWATTGALILFVSAALTLLMRRLPWAATGWFWYLGTLVPVIGLVQVGDQAMADRYTYIPLTGLFILAAWGAGELTGRSGRGERFASAAAGLVLIILGAMARRQAGFWRESVTLFEHTVAVTSENWIALGILGIALAEKGEFGRAITRYEEALRIHPDYLVARYGLGNALQEVGRLDAAAAQYRAALRLNPRHLGALNNLGTTLYRQKKLPEAVQALRRALEVNPGLSEAHVNLGNALAEMGRTAEAAGHFREALRIKPALEAQRREMEAALRRHGGSGIGLSP
jgi:tetratricopeptide (TPR) repeat protein